MAGVRFDPGNERVYVCVRGEAQLADESIGCNRFPRGIPPSPWVLANRGDNLRRLDAAAWSNPRYQPIGSRLRGLERRTKGSLPIERRGGRDRHAGDQQKRPATVYTERITASITSPTGSNKATLFGTTTRPTDFPSLASSNHLGV